MKKSVLFLVQNLPVPQDRRIMMEARALEKSGYTVSIISPRKPEQAKFEIEDGNEKDLAGKIQYILDNQSLADKLGKNAKSFLENRFGSEKYFQELTSLYSGLK